MQHVLGTYASRAAAETAVRGLESDGLSIQNVVIADHQHRVWRKLHARAGGEAVHPRRGFVVYTTDEPEMSEWARTLLAAQSPAT
ncbi:MAG TPA: hypothetical protein VFZ61_19350 [Polyangiales bacterium]